MYSSYPVTVTQVPQPMDWEERVAPVKKDLENLHFKASVGIVVLVVACFFKFIFLPSLILGLIVGEGFRHAANLGIDLLDEKKLIGGNTLRKLLKREEKEGPVVDLGDLTKRIALGQTLLAGMLWLFCSSKNRLPELKHVDLRNCEITLVEIKK